jgi:hypothetical protein
MFKGETEESKVARIANSKTTWNSKGEIFRHANDKVNYNFQLQVIVQCDEITKGQGESEMIFK